MGSSTTLLSVAEYLGTSYKPACEYIDGVLRQKPMPTRKHGVIQGRVAQLINEKFPSFEAAPEVSAQVREGKFLVPDVLVQERSRLQDPYPTSAVYLCVEVLSPTDKMSEALAKCEDYHAWGVPVCWIIDPESQRAWQYLSASRPVECPRSGVLEAAEIGLSWAEIFSVLQ
jgi:Uma2 family endonuclease